MDQIIPDKIGKDIFFKEAIAQIPKILTLLDRNPHSPSYGCFDRNYWHYKIIDFPNGMSQEFVWPLALIYDTNIQDNPYYKVPALREWVAAGIRFAANNSHKDGSCDDYYPNERAGGATAFSLLAFLESYVLMRFNDPLMTHFFETRANWLANHLESGQLANHQALIVLCLTLASKLLVTHRWDKTIQDRLELVYSWQSQEGWFKEYEGFDPGYHTLTISCLARLYDLNPDDRLKNSLTKSVILASHFVHPDGSYGGEYGSRNTYNFFPHGFELVGKWMPEALIINDRILEGLAYGKGACYADDHIIGHHTWNYLLTWRDFVKVRPPKKTITNGRIWLPEAGILIDRRDNVEIFLAANKGGSFKFFRENQLVLSDTNFSVLVQIGGKVKNVVGNLVGDYEIQIQNDTIIIEGNLGWAKQKEMNTIHFISLRFLMFTVGRLYPDLIRKLLQNILITGKKDAPFKFFRRFKWQDEKWHLTDILQTENWDPVIDVRIGGDQTSIYVAMSRTFQIGQLQPWLDLSDEVLHLKQGDSLKCERIL